MVGAFVAGLAPAMAVEIAGVTVAEKFAIGQSGPERVLNGAGVRKKLMSANAYVGVLYLSAIHRIATHE